METALAFIAAHIHVAPFVIFGLLLLAGFCLPVSEDVMIFTTAMLCNAHPHQMIPLIIGLCAGIYFSDLIAYGLGYFLGNRIHSIPVIKNFIDKEKIELVHGYFVKRGIITLIIGRFIPFGVRNALFLSAGISKMNLAKFALADLIAATISTSVFFPLYYHFGEPVVEWVKKGNIVIFSVFVVGVVLYLLIRKSNK